MNARKLILKMLIVAELALLVSCSTGVVRESSFTNEINSEFHGIECADHKHRFKTTILNCYLDLTTNYKRGNNNNENKTLRQRTVASNPTPQRP